MISAMHLNRIPNTGGCVLYPAATERGKDYPASLVIVARTSLPDDPIGTHALTLQHVPAGARVQVEDENGTTVLSSEIATGTNGTFVTYSKTLQVYAGGSALNNWRIKVRKASETPFYRPYETLMTATVGASSIYVSMIQDD
jgi:hypothetical protein